MRNIRINRAVALIIAIVLYASPWARAEVGSMGELSGNTVLSSGGSGGGSEMADKMAGGMMVNPNTIVDKSAENKANGREYKAGDAQRQANAGKAAAIAAGATMIATGTPMLASPIAAVRAAGAALIAKGTIEFAQAAASAGAANDNRGQKQILTSDDGQSGAQSSPSGGAAQTKQEVARALSNNSQLNQFLASRGVNPDDFANRVANGELTNAQDVLTAVGDTASYSPEDFAKGEAIAAQQAAGKPEPLGGQDNLRVLNDDSVKPREGLDAGRDSVASAGGIRGNTDLEGRKGSERAQQSTPDTGAGTASTSAAGLKADGLLSSEGRGGAGLAALLAGHDPAMVAQLMNALGLGADAGTAAKGAAALRSELGKLGIIRLTARQNIFQLAHRNFRSFQKWRRQAKSRSRIANR